MGYKHIDNLYKQIEILLFKECYALEKIHGTSAHIKFKADTKTLTFYSGGEKHEKFIKLFDQEELLQNFLNIFVDSDVIVYGEAYGGSCQRMSGTYGLDLKFVAFEVQVGEIWLNVPNAHDVVNKLGLEFVDYEKIPADLEAINKERDKDSTQAIRNGVGVGKIREGVVLRPLIELTMNNGERIIVKHKRDEFKETATPREVSAEQQEVLEEANAIADEWVTEIRLDHVLDKLPQDIGIESTGLVIKAMIADVYREGVGELVESREATKAISSRTAKLFKAKVSKISKI